ncbi:RDD family protein [Hugenholtzia roseola]|uniref:RDD family protein n=1 Tax=Hugenholtzia roseola TaxID=1002 RepID=UPI00047C6854|nr:RDD family protein [Hugenholtzia roseola]
MATFRPHVHQIDAYAQAHFLKEERQDPITGEAFVAGDSIVFCAACRSAFLLESWQYMGNQHCGQGQTLAQFPKSQSLTLSKSKNVAHNLTDLRHAKKEERLLALFIDMMVLPILGGIWIQIIGFILNIVQSLGSIGLFFEGLVIFIGIIVGTIPLLARDFIGGKSIGKRIVGLRSIDRSTGESANLLQSFKKTLSLPFEPLRFLLNRQDPKTLGDSWSDTIVVKD